MRLALLLALSAACASESPSASQGSALQTGNIRTVFLIMMENHSWAQIKGSSSAPYLNGLLSQAAHAEAYRNPGYLHPSLPNYLWLEAGTNFGIQADGDPGTYHQATTQHFVSLLDAQGYGWKSYLEDIDGTSCPLSGSGKYAPRHNGPLYFDDVTNGNSTSSANCVAHVRPYSELASDLANGTVPAFAYITPNLCDDMHDTVGCASLDSVKNGDSWLSREVPKILASSQFQSGGALFITWDESEASEAPMGMIVLSPFAKAGYASTVALTHSSTLRTFEEIFGLSPFLGGAAEAADLSDLFQNSLAKACTADAQCGAGQVCTNGRCAANPPAGACQSDADCTGGNACVTGTCQTRPSSSCPPGTTDIGGTCVPTGCSSNTPGWLAALALLAIVQMYRRTSRRRSPSRA
ncbi:MAG: alkaline phosphatase family protein [Myxococcales bacterium]